jgi:cystathionine gamma-synthase
MSGDDFRTRVVHAGLEPDPAWGSVIPAIHQSSTFAQRAVGEVVEDFDYSRAANPTRSALERALGDLEGGHGSAFASGMAATHALVTAACSAGDHVVIPADLYGGTYRLVDKVLSRWGLRYTMVDQTDLDALAAAVTDDTRLIWVETPTNPLLNVVDVAEVVARRRNALVAVDNTFATPANQRPLEDGADAVVHSTTKYLGGHSDVIGGFAATNDPTVAERLRFLQKSLGAVPGPFDAWLVLRGIKTLALRMRQHCLNATEVAAVLSRHPRVEQVFYPGLPTHPGHTIAASQMRDFGGMVSFLAESPEEAEAIAGRTQLFQLAESLGGVESLIEVPARMTHAATSNAPFAAPPNLIRLSVGIESAADLMDDLERALVPATARTH